MEEYKDIKDMLKPRRDFTASNELRNLINLTLDSSTRKRKTLWWIWGIGASCVAAAVLMAVLMPSRMFAKEVFEETIKTLINSNNIEMTVEVRTRPMENFRYINPSEDFVLHKISIAKSDSTYTWRIDKGGRTATGNNEVIYNWIDELNIGWRTCNVDPKEVLGEMALLLTPEKILESELQNCVNNSEARYEVEKKNGEIVLTVHYKPQGDFSNPYKLNASIAESENIRTYVIDAETKHLKTASVSIIHDKKKTEILKITNVIYDLPHTNLNTLPSGIRFIDMTTNSLHGLDSLDPVEAASAFLNALETWNRNLLEKAMDTDVLEAIYRKEFQGAVPESIGSAFTSGKEGNIYVPYTLRMPDGTTRCHNLVLQNLSSGGWIVVGGL